MEARAAADFGRFRDALAHQLELRHRYVACFDPFAHPYDVLLDDFEPGMTVAERRAAVRRARGRASCRSSRRPRATRGPATAAPFGGPYELEDQRRALMSILEGVGFDPDGWRLDIAPHPFAQGIGARRRPDHHPLRPARLRRRAYFAALHEFGHGLYEAGIPARLAAQPARLAGLARRPRVAEPAVGEPRRPLAPVLRLGCCRGCADELARRPRRRRRRRALPRVNPSSAR